MPFFVNVKISKSVFRSFRLSFSSFQDFSVFFFNSFNCLHSMLKFVNLDSKSQFKSLVESNSFMKDFFWLVSSSILSLNDSLICLRDLICSFLASLEDCNFLHSTNKFSLSSKVKFISFDEFAVSTPLWELLPANSGSTSFVSLLLKILEIENRFVLSPSSPLPHSSAFKLAILVTPFVETLSWLNELSMLFAYCPAELSLSLFFLCLLLWDIFERLVESLDRCVFTRLYSTLWSY
uniref:Putative uncharacterized membrane protein YDR149C n=1 Tax=Saccharomyces cerevisiae (strain ATCC 204508 / S288c) TaxID=559292 RepID=YD149_YEAST|nr:RecName: Full=Putative uncharacterized membrane protein YDR149C [Saccharomyces cerevisiae S288C]AHX39260.1 hypothetical protein YDR149C [Saccharomyces cerevisiae]